jgi:hypothetical protein
MLYVAVSQVQERRMFSITVKFADRSERLLSSEVIDWEPSEVGGRLVLDEDEVVLADGDAAFVTNASGQTVRIYGKRR